MPAVTTGRATITDVARKAGVSKATVSRFLNHHDTLLKRDIAARVETAIAALASTPSPMAQALKRGSPRLIGQVVADMTKPYSVAVLHAAEKACQDAGCLVMPFNLGNQVGREREAIEALSPHPVDGFILNTPGHDSGALEAAVRHGKPVVLVDRRHSEMQADFVSLDNDGAVRLGAEHLVAAGYRELLFVSEPLKDVSSRIERETAFRAFVAVRGASVKGRSFESTADDTDALDGALRSLRKRAGTRAPAVSASNAPITLRVAASMARLGWQFGTEVGLVGFDDTESAPLLGPGLTAIAQPTDDLGRVAATCLIVDLRGLEMPPRQILLPGQLVARGSSRLA